MKSFSGVGLITLGILAASQVQAAEYSVTPFATARAEYDTNRRLTADEEKSTFGQSIDVGALFGYQSDTSSVSITPKFSIQRRGDDGSGIDQDRENYFINANGQHRFNERWSGGATFDFSNTGVVASELDDEGIIIQDVNESFTRETISFGPSVTYILSERNSLRFGAGYSEATYDNQNTLLSDYENFSVNGSWIHQLSETNQFVVSVFGSIQDPELNNQVLRSAGPGSTADLITGDNPSNDNVPDPVSLKNKFNQFGVNFQYIRGFTPTLTGTFGIGFRRTTGDFPDLIDYDIDLGDDATSYLANPSNSPGIPNRAFYTNQNPAGVFNRNDPIFNNAAFLDEYRRNTGDSFFSGAQNVQRVYDQGSVSNSGVLFDVSLEKRYERTTYTARLSRASLPSGTGLTERDEYALYATHDFSDRMQATGSFRYITTENESQLTLSEGRSQSTDQIRLEAGLNYRWTEFWTLGAGYQYRERSPEEGDSADSHVVFFTIGYNGRRYARSR